MCALHGIRFKYRQYFLAKEHVRTVYHPPDTSTLKLLTNTSYCQLTSDNIGGSNQKNNLSYDCDDVIDNSSFDSGSDNLAHSIATDSLSNSTITEFKDGQKPVLVDDYNVNMRRYIESESTSPNSGLKRIIGCAFTMNLSTDPSLISLNEALFHLKSTLFCSQLTSQQKSEFSSLCHMMSSTFYSSPHDITDTLKTKPPSTGKEIDRYYLKISTSVAQNIPIPTINEMNDHAFVSIKDAIKHFLCFETNIDGILIEKVTSNYKNIVSMSSSASDSNAMQLLREKVKSKIPNNDISPLRST